MLTISRFTEKYLSNSSSEILIIHDEPFETLANSLGRQYGTKGISASTFLVKSQTSLSSAVEQCISKKYSCLVLFEPNSYIEFRLRDKLDFSHGEPKIARLSSSSYISIFPVDSAMRLYSSEDNKDDKAKDMLLRKLKDNSKYVLTTDNGTHLNFTSRNWIEQSDEILTAPIENSISGRIAVDGAVFFKKIQTTFYINIENGLVSNLTSDTVSGNELLREYSSMTKGDFLDDNNKQLAEIGIGFNTHTIVSDCFMEAETVFGTCHFCFGNNICYGGNNKSDFHGGSVLIMSPRFQCLS